MASPANETMAASAGLSSKEQDRVLLMVQHGDCCRILPRPKTYDELLANASEEFSIDGQNGHIALEMVIDSPQGRLRGEVSRSAFACLRSGDVLHVTVRLPKPVTCPPVHPAAVVKDRSSPDPLTLPTPKPRPVLSAHRAAAHTGAVPPGLSHRPSFSGREFRQVTAEPAPSASASPPDGRRASPAGLDLLVNIVSQPRSPPAGKRDPGKEMIEQLRREHGLDGSTPVSLETLWQDKAPVASSTTPQGTPPPVSALKLPGALASALGQAVADRQPSRSGLHRARSVRFDLPARSGEGEGTPKKPDGDAPPPSAPPAMMGGAGLKEQRSMARRGTLRRAQSAHVVSPKAADSAPGACPQRSVTLPSAMKSNRAGYIFSGFGPSDELVRPTHVVASPVAEGLYDDKGLKGAETHRERDRRRGAHIRRSSLSGGEVPRMVREKQTGAEGRQGEGGGKGLRRRRSAAALTIGVGPDPVQADPAQKRDALNERRSPLAPVFPHSQSHTHPSLAPPATLPMAFSPQRPGSPFPALGSRRPVSLASSVSSSSSSGSGDSPSPPFPLTPPAHVTVHGGRNPADDLRVLVSNFLGPDGRLAAAMGRKPKTVAAAGAAAAAAAAGNGQKEGEDQLAEVWRLPPEDRAGAVEWYLEGFRGATAATTTAPAPTAAVL